MVAGYQAATDEDELRPDLASQGISGRALPVLLSTEPAVSKSGAATTILRSPKGPHSGNPRGDSRRRGDGREENAILFHFGL